MTLIVWGEFPWLLREKSLVGGSKQGVQPGATPRSVRQNAEQLALLVAGHREGLSSWCGLQLPTTAQGDPKCPGGFLEG